MSGDFVDAVGNREVFDHALLADVAEERDFALNAVFGRHHSQRADEDVGLDADLAASSLTECWVGLDLMLIGAGEVRNEGYVR